MRILFIAPTANMSGGIKSIRFFAEAMVRRNHHVTIACRRLPHILPRPWRVRRFIRELRKKKASFGRQQHHLEGTKVKIISVKHNAVSAEDVPDADIVIGTWWQTIEWIADWPESKGIKVYLVQGHELYGGDNERVRATYRMPIQKLVVSTWLQRVMATEYNDHNAVLVPNGIDWSQFDSVPRSRNETPTVGFLYSSKPLKGIDTAFHATRLLQKQWPSLNVVLFGNRPLTSNKAAPVNMEFHLLPPQESIADIYRKSDVWVISSTTEGFGLPGLEAAACRCPLVATRCGGPEDYIEQGKNGFLVPVGNAEAMAQAIGSILEKDDHEWRAMSEASYRIAKRFDWDHSAEIMERTLMTLLQRYGL